VARDLMFQQEIKDTVQRAYAAIATGAGGSVARRHYSDQELAEVPDGAIGWALGVGNPVRYARLQPGQVVLDVGSGGGIDTILAARRVGPEGRAVGLDMSARKSRALAEIFRVLRPEGRICMADLTVEGELPPEVANDQSAWAG